VGRNDPFILVSHSVGLGSCICEWACLWGRWQWRARACDWSFAFAATWSSDSAAVCAPWPFSQRGAFL